jgi:bifunctional non-homologous end joining protein LigD
MRAADGGKRTVVGTAVRVSSPDRVLFPATGFTKADLAAFYVAIAPVLLPHVAGHPLTLHRFPEGLGGPSFFQTRAPSHPAWIRVQRMYTFRSGKEVDAVVLDDVDGLVWAANLSTIELHPFLACADDLEHPGVVVFDLDPGRGATFADACEVATRVRAIAGAARLVSYAKVSGGLGVHVVVPVSWDHSFAETKAFARAVAALLARDEPDRVTDMMPVHYRTGRVFVDWSQNDAGKSTIAPYSLRANAAPTVALPVTWSEIEHVAATRDPRSLVFTPRDALRRVAEQGDLLATVARDGDRPRLPTAGE